MNKIIAKLLIILLPLCATFLFHHNFLHSYESQSTSNNKVYNHNHSIISASELVKKLSFKKVPINHSFNDEDCIILSLCVILKNMLNIIVFLIFFALILFSYFGNFRLLFIANNVQKNYYSQAPPISC